MGSSMLALQTGVEEESVVTDIAEYGSQVEKTGQDPRKCFLIVLWVQ